MKASIADHIQAALHQENLNGWLFYSFRGSDPFAEVILHLDHDRLAARRWFYFVPAVGEPTKLVHAIESEMLDGLPGDKKVYLPWQHIHSHLVDILAGSRRIAMQYSPLNAIPYISRNDAGTIERIRIFGVDVVASADLAQTFEAVWAAGQGIQLGYERGRFSTYRYLGQEASRAFRLRRHNLDGIYWSSVPDSNAAIFQVVKSGRDAANGSFIAPDIPFTKEITAMVRISTTLKLRTIAA